MLTAKAEESDELVGLAVGADDYVTKPYSLKILISADQERPPPPPGPATTRAPAR